MPRPRNKTALIEESDKEFSKLCQTIDSMNTVEQQARFDYQDAFFVKHTEAHWKRDKNLRDVLIHLYEWHRLLLDWIASNQRGEKLPFLPAPYNWKNYGEMNEEFWRRHQSTSLSDAYEMLQRSHREVMVVLEGFSQEELFSKGQFSWTGGSTLGSYGVSATSSHYAWASKKLRQHIRNHRR